MSTQVAAAVQYNNEGMIVNGMKIHMIWLGVLTCYCASAMRPKDFPTYSLDYVLPPSPPIPTPVTMASTQATNAQPIADTTQTTPELPAYTTAPNTTETPINNSASGTSSTAIPDIPSTSDINSRNPQLGYENGVWSIGGTSHDQLALSETQMLRILTSLPPESLAQVQNGNTAPILSYVQQYPDTIQLRMHLSSIPATTKASDIINSQKIMRTLQGRFNSASRARRNQQMVTTTNYSLSTLCSLYAQKNIQALERIKYVMESDWCLSPAANRGIKQLIGHADAMIASLKELRGQEQLQFHEFVTDQSQIIKKHQDGDKEGLRQEIRRLQSVVMKPHSSQMHLTQLHGAIKSIEERINDPATESLHIIKTADLATAKAEYEKLHKADAARPTTMKYGGKIKQGSPLSRDYFGFDQLQTAKAILESRHDYRAEHVALHTNPLPITGVQTTANMPTASTASSSTASSAAQVPATTDLLVNGANASSALSSMTDDPLMILDLEQAVAMNQVVLDMVMTGPAQLPISPEAQELVNSKLAELADKYQANDSLRYLEALANTLQCIQEHNPRNVSLQLLQALQTKGHIEPSDIPLLYQCALHLTHGIVQTITDVPGLIHAHAKLVKLIFECAIVDGLREWQIDPIQALGPDNEVSKVAKAIEAINPESIKKVLQHIALMNPQEQSKAVGNIVGSYLQGKILAGLIPTALKTVENITQVVAEGRVGQAMAQSVEKLAHGARRIGTAEEVIAVTTEGIPVRIATAAQETMSFQQARQKVGSAAKEAEGLLVGVAEQAAIKTLTDSVTATVQQDIPRLRQLFDGKVKGFKEFANKFLKFEYEHTLGIDLTWTRRGMPNIGGFHHDMMGLVEKSGIFEFANKRMLSNGFYKAELFFKGHKVKEVTFFPSNWSREKVISKIIEAYENAIKSGIELSLEPNQKYKLAGMIEEGIEIEMHITQQGKVTSGYPIIK